MNMHKERREENESSLIDYVSPVTILKRCQYALLFGSRHAQGPLVRRTADLFNDGYFERIVVTGGPTCQQSRSEAEQLAEQLEAAGIAGGRILLETASFNTKENIVLSRLLFQNNPISELLLIGKIYAKRRYVMTIKRHWPEIDQVFCDAINYFGVSREHWRESPGLMARIFSESKKITDYLKSGDIAEVEVKDGKFVLRT
jgi:uncharacterized SAM-binding protein YcdF (DUF218 family)